MSLKHAKQACLEGRLAVDERVYDQLVAMSIPLHQAREAIQFAMTEVAPDHVTPMETPWNPPGHGFTWHSEYFGCEMYLKVRIEGERARCKLYSLHQPVHAGRTGKGLSKRLTE